MSAQIEVEQEGRGCVSKPRLEQVNTVSSLCASTICVASTTESDEGGESKAALLPKPSTFCETPCNIEDVASSLTLIPVQWVLMLLKCVGICSQDGMKGARVS